MTRSMTRAFTEMRMKEYEELYIDEIRAEGLAKREERAKQEARAMQEAEAMQEAVQPEYSLMMVRIIGGQAYVLPMNHSIDYKRAVDGTLTGLNITFQNSGKFKLNTNFAATHFSQRIKFEYIKEL